jgi:protein O-mannosyl-transferase
MSHDKEMKGAGADPSPPASGSAGTVVRDLLACAFLVALTWACFHSVLRYDFVNFDDDKYVTENPAVLSGLSGKSITSVLTVDKELYLWLPVTMLSHAIDVELFGMDAGKHHGVSLLVHSLSAMFLFLALKRLTRRTWPCLFISAFFAIHPLSVEPMAWISSRKDVLSTFFFVLTLWAYAGYVARKDPKQYILAILFCALGLASKAMLVTAPIVLLLLDYWPLGRWNPPDISSEEVWKRRKKLVIEKVPFFVLAFLCGVISLLAEAGHMSATHPHPLGYRAANTFLTYGELVYRLILPFGLAPSYPYLSPGWTFLLGGLMAALAAGLLAGAWQQRTKRPYLLAGLLWYLVTLVPTSGVLQVASHRVADRYAYLPQIGLLLAAAWGIAEATKGLRWKRYLLSAGAIAVLTALFFVSRSQVQTWRNSETLFLHAITVTSRNDIAYNQLGKALVDQGRYDEAARHFAASLRANSTPVNASAAKNLGLMNLQLKRYEEAVVCFKGFLELKPYDPIARYCLALALARQGHLEEAASHAEKTLRLDPGMTQARELLAAIQQQKGPGGGETR